MQAAPCATGLVECLEMMLRRSPAEAHPSSEAVTRYRDEGNASARKGMLSERPPAPSLAIC